MMNAVCVGIHGGQMMSRQGTTTIDSLSEKGHNNNKPALPGAKARARAKARVKARAQGQGQSQGQETPKGRKNRFSLRLLQKNRIEARSRQERQGAARSRQEPPRG